MSTMPRQKEANENGSGDKSSGSGSSIAALNSKETNIKSPSNPSPLAASEDHVELRCKYCAKVCVNIGSKTRHEENVHKGMKFMA